MAPHTPHRPTTARSRVASRPAARGVLVALVVLTAAFALHPVQADGHVAGSVGVSPATAHFDDPPLLPGGTSQVVLHFQQHYAEPVRVHVAPLAIDPDMGDAHTWFGLDRSGEMLLAPGTHPFTIHIQVPDDTPNGQYKGGVAFRVDPPHPTEQEGSSATTETSVTATLSIVIDNENEVKAFRVDGAPTIAPLEEGTPLRVVQTVTNTGNVRVVPQVRVEVQDRLQETTVQTFSLDGSVLRPGVQADQVFTASDHGLERGQYWATVHMLLDDAVVHTAAPVSFDVLAPGELARMAELRSIRIQDDASRVQAGSLVKLTAVVANVGDGPITGIFEGEVYRNGVLVEPLESKPTEIGTGETGNLTMLYRVGDAGKYEFKGRVFYGAKVTEEKSLLLTAGEETNAVPAPGFAMLAGLLAALVVVLGWARGRPEKQDR